jgi:hypothetical protein
VTSVNGVATVNFTPSTAGLATITASATGLTSDTASLTVIDPVIIKISGDNQSGTVGTALSSPFVIEVLDNGSGTALANTAVDFTVSAGGGSVSPASVVTDNNGRASATLILGNQVGANTVDVTTAGAANVQFSATAGPSAGTKLALSPPSSAVLVNGTIAYSATVQDVFGNTVTTASNPVSFAATGVSGTFSPSGPVTPVSGVALVSFTPTTSGTGTVTASATGLIEATASVEARLGTITKVSGDNQIGNPGTALSDPLIVEVRDGNNAPLVGMSVNFTVTAGGGSVAPASAITGSDGRASTTLTLGPVPGLNKVTAAAVDVGSVDFTAGVPNAIYLENQKPGTTAWGITNPVTVTGPEIAGYANATSVNLGETLALKVSLATPGAYTIDVYRLGYYGGLGGRLMASSGTLTGITQPDCSVTDPATLLIECDWGTSYNLQIGTDWTTGLYIADLTESAGGKQSQIWFVVRDDSSVSDVVFQSSFSTFLAYNHYGTNERHSLYGWNSTGGQRAFAVSFDRPFGQVTTDPDRFENLLRYEYSMVRWLESQAYDVSYITNMDVQTNPGLLLQHKVYLSVGHDEYWSEEMRNGVEQARNAGVNLGFFSSNTGYWRVRFEPSTITGQANRVMVCYKDPLANDPVAPTYLWRGPENNRPENALLGVMYIGDDNGVSIGYDHIVSNSAHYLYDSTGLSDGDALFALVGFEWDAVVNNGFTPPGLVTLSESVVVPLTIAPGLPPGTDLTISNSTYYTDSNSGARVFATGSMQWMWGLDSFGVIPSREDVRAKQFAVNVLADMGVLPFTPDPGLVLP